MAQSDFERRRDERCTAALRNPGYDRWKLASPPEWEDEVEEEDDADGDKADEAYERKYK